MAVKKAIKKSTKSASKKVENTVVTENTENLEGRYELPRNMEITEIGIVYKDVQEFLSKAYKKCVLDAGNVALIDSAGIQFIVQLLQTLKTNGCEVGWENDSIQIYQMAAELGLADHLEV